VTRKNLSSKLYKKSFNIIVYSLVVAISHAQESERSKDLVKPNSDEVKRHIPTTKKGLKNTAETVVKVVEPKKALTARQKLLNKHFALAKRMNLAQAKRHEDIKNGKVDSFADAKAALPLVMSNLEKLKTLESRHAKEENLPQRRELEAQIIELLQPIGPWLTVADYDLKNVSSLTEQQLAKANAADERLENFQAQHKDTAKEKANYLSLTSSAQLYTLKNVPIHICIKAPAHSEVILTAESGGRFPSGSNVEVHKATAEGDVIAYWYTEGDAIGQCQVSAVSPECVNSVSTEINVVQLLPDVANFAFIHDDLKQAPQQLQSSAEQARQFLATQKANQ